MEATTSSVSEKASPAQPLLLQAPAPHGLPCLCLSPRWGSLSASTAFLLKQIPKLRNLHSLTKSTLFKFILHLPFQDSSQFSSVTQSCPTLCDLGPELGPDVD